MGNVLFTAPKRQSSSPLTGNKLTNGVCTDKAKIGDMHQAIQIPARQASSLFAAGLERMPDGVALAGLAGPRGTAQQRKRLCQSVGREQKRGVSSAQIDKGVR